MRAFEQAGAISPDTACTADQLGMKPGMAWQQLAGQAVLRSPGAGRWFVDQANWQRLRKRRHHLAVVLAVIVLVLLAILVMRRLG